MQPCRMPGGETMKMLERCQGDLNEPPLTRSFKPGAKPVKSQVEHPVRHEFTLLDGACGDEDTA